MTQLYCLSCTVVGQQGDLNLSPLVAFTSSSTLPLSSLVPPSLCHFCDKYNRILQNFSQFFPALTSLEIPLPTLSPPNSCIPPHPYSSYSSRLLPPCSSPWINKDNYYENSCYSNWSFFLLPLITWQKCQLLSEVKSPQQPCQQLWQQRREQALEGMMHLGLHLSTVEDGLLLPDGDAWNKIEDTINWNSIAWTDLYRMMQDWVVISCTLKTLSRYFTEFWCN